MSDTYQFRTADRNDDTRVIDRDDLSTTELFTPATPRWIPPKSKATLREEREEVVRRDAVDFGGFKWGSAFFGWVTATGLTVLLAAALGGVGTAVGLALNSSSATQLERAARTDAGMVGLVGAIALGVILLVAYYCGGYVAGRMARFAGLKQGLAVWLWAVAFAIVGTGAVWLSGFRYDVLGAVSGLPGVPSDQGTLMVIGLVALVGVAVLSLGGALLGGRLGMRYHRLVDFASVGD